MLYILLSTYNGENYLKALLDSLMSQDYAFWKIIIRDDGSTDGTIKILQDHTAAANGKIELQLGKNIGVVASFFELLRVLPDDCDYVGFCDQDDVWHKDKLSRAVAVIKQAEVGQNIPVMYCSKLDVVDKDLQHLWFSPSPRKKFSLANAIFENVATGCSMVLNKPALSLLLSRKPNLNCIIMHDWWIYMLISAVGKVIYDEHATVLYRLHSNNTVGVTRGIKTFLSQLHRLMKSRSAAREAQVREFQRVYYDILPVTSKQCLDLFLECKKHKCFSWQLVKVALTGPFYRQKFLDNIFLKKLIVLGLY